MNNNDVLISVDNLKKYFPADKKLFQREKSFVHAVDDVSFSICRGETMGLVGESGCGKTTVGRTIIRLYKPTAGKIVFDGQDITNLDKKEFSVYRRRMQMIFQDPYSCLDPRMYVRDIIGEGLEANDIAHGKEKEEIVIDLLNKVGLKKDHAARFAHEFSGGQRQRIGIARALAVNPDFIVCDEPIAALDVSIQAQVVNMLRDLQEEFGMTYLFIAHDLSMVKYISDHVGVMYIGRMMEKALSDELYAHPAHPYTKALMSAIPNMDACTGNYSRRITLQGDVASPIDPPSACLFAGRCQYCEKRCQESAPALKEISPGHFAACHLL